MKKSQNRASHNHFTSQGYGASQEEHMHSTNCDKSQEIKILTFITMEYQKKNLLKSGIKLLTQTSTPSIQFATSMSKYDNKEFWSGITPSFKFFHPKFIEIKGDYKFI